MFLQPRRNNLFCVAHFFGIVYYLRANCVCSSFIDAPVCAPVAVIPLIFYPRGLTFFYSHQLFFAFSEQPGFLPSTLVLVPLIEKFCL